MTGYQGMDGAPFPRALAGRATDLGIIVYRMHGSTGHPSITGCTSVGPLENRLHGDGRPLPGVEVRLVGSTGREVGPGRPGAVLSHGPDCFLGCTEPDLTARALDVDGWYHIGDIRISDAAGYIAITDRNSPPRPQARSKSTCCETG